MPLEDEHLFLGVAILRSWMALYAPIAQLYSSIVMIPNMQSSVLEPGLLEGS